MNTTSRILLTSLALCVLVNIVFLHQITHASSFLFTRTLKVGLLGEDVRELQKILNKDPNTQVQSSGPGSSGQETLYFGILTRDAVIRFQEKYKYDILVPNSLISGTGFVGQSTITMLNKLAKEVNLTASSLISTSTLMSASKIQNLVVQTSFSNQGNIVTKNPNQENLDLIFAAIDRVGKKQGLSKEKIASVKKIVITQAATTTDLKGKFIEVVRSSISKSPQPVQNFFADLIKPFKEVFSPKKAMAIGGTPFGGALLFSMYCTQTENWWIGVEPLGPTYVSLLTYQTGSQIYLGYNIPFTTELLGEYQQGGECVEGECPYCETMPSEGMISPGTGSSSL